MRMKIIVPIILTFCLVIVGGYSFWSTHISANDIDRSEYRIDFPEVLAFKGDPTFELDTTLPDKKEVMIYKVTQSHISADMASNVAMKLGFEGKATSLDEIDLLPDGDRHFMRWQNSGAISYDNSEIIFPEEAPNLPSKEEAKKIAIEFLAECGLLPSDVIIEEPVAGSSYGGVNEDSLEYGEPQSISYIGHWLVRFTINIDGCPIAGPGNKFAVRVGNNGEVGGLFVIWRDVEPYKSINIKSAQQALQELEDGKGEHRATLDCGKVIIKRVYLAYWMESANTTQENVVPVYVFEGDCLDINGKYLDNFRGWCNAV